MDSSCLASYVVFRELYDIKKNDVYNIISMFVADIIISKHLLFFSSVEMTQSINSEYNFNLLENIIKTSIGRLPFVRKDRKGIYIVDRKGNLEESAAVAEIKNDAITASESVIEELILYVDYTEKKKLNEVERSDLRSAFCAFLLDGESGTPYSKSISSFIIANQNNVEVMRSVDAIREGAILYAGLNYNIDINIQKN